MLQIWTAVLDRITPARKLHTPRSRGTSVRADLWGENLAPTHQVERDERRRLQDAKRFAIVPSCSLRRLMVET